MSPSSVSVSAPPSASEPSPARSSGASPGTSSSSASRTTIPGASGASQSSAASVRSDTTVGKSETGTGSARREATAPRTQAPMPHTRPSRNKNPPIHGMKNDRRQITAPTTNAPKSPPRRNSTRLPSAVTAGTAPTTKPTTPIAIRTKARGMPTSVTASNPTASGNRITAPRPTSKDRTGCFSIAPTARLLVPRKSQIATIPATRNPRNDTTLAMDRMRLYTKLLCVGSRVTVPPTVASGEIEASAGDR